MQVEVAICTWNRAELLTRTLARLSEINVPSGVELRILLINNASTDRTSEVIEQFQPQLPLVPMMESQQGHTFARNRAIEAATGELLLWIDDDVIVGETWLKDYILASKNPEFDFWGGPIRPRFEPERPDWISENWSNLKGCFAERELGENPIELNRQKLPYGANFGIRTSLQKQFLFDTDWGRQGDSVVGEDELQVMRRVLEAGHRGEWVPGAGVEHVIDAARATEGYIQRYFVGQGRRIVIDGTGWGWSRPALWCGWKWEQFCYHWTRRKSHSPRWVGHLIRSGLAEGQYLQKRAGRVN